MPRINRAEPAHLDVLGKQLDFDDLPLRWNGSQQAFELAPEVLERTEKLLGDLRQLSGLTASMRRQAEQYRPVVEKYADRYNLSPDLVFAIIYTESDFDPDLISNRSAHGLMQVVPDTAGSAAPASHPLHCCCIPRRTSSTVQRTCISCRTGI